MSCHSEKMQSTVTLFIIAVQYRVTLYKYITCRSQGSVPASKGTNHQNWQSWINLGIIVPFHFLQLPNVLELAI